MKNKDLDNFFKSKSNSFDEMPSDDLWKKIQNNLSQEPRPKSNFQKTFFTMILPTIALFSIIALFLNSEKSPQKTNGTLLNNDSIKKEKTVVILDTNTKLKSTLPILDLKKTSPTTNAFKNTTIVKDSVKTNDISVAHSINDTTTVVIEYPYSVNSKTSSNEEKKPVINEQNFSAPKEKEIKSRKSVIEFSETSSQENTYSINEVDIKPEFPGGINKLYQFISKNYRTIEGRPAGRIGLTFVIEKDGSLTYERAAIEFGFNVNEKTIIDLLKKYPKCIPGKKNGNPVRVSYTCRFEINGETEEESQSKSIIAKEIIETDTSVYSMAGIEQKPEFIGGMQRLYAFITKNYKNPVNCPNGKVYMTFIVEKDGSLSDIKCVRDLGFGSGKEAIRVLQECPNWIPGEQNGRKVRVLYSMPITINNAEK